MGCPDDFSFTKTLHSLPFSNKMEAIHLNFGASNFSSVIPFPLYLRTCTHAPIYPVIAVVNSFAQEHHCDQAAMALRA